MRITLSMRQHTYRSFGRCIYCLESKPEEELTDEHIIPFALNGSLVIENAACEPCRARSNEVYENPTLQTMLLVPRLLLELNRRKKTEKKLPPLWPGGTAHLTSVEGLERFAVGLDEYPPIMLMVVLGPAGKLLGIDQRVHNKSRLWLYNFGAKETTAQSVTARQIVHLGNFGLMACKIAYCYAVAELGIDGFDGNDIRDLLAGKRDDVFNFFGGSIDDDRLSRNELHGLMLRERNGYKTVLVQLFSTLRAPPYEIPVGPA